MKECDIFSFWYAFTLSQIKLYLTWFLLSFNTKAVSERPGCCCLPCLWLTMWRQFSRTSLYAVCFCKEPIGVWMIAQCAHEQPWTAARLAPYAGLLSYCTLLLGGKTIATGCCECWGSDGSNLRAARGGTSQGWFGFLHECESCGRI